MLLQNVWNTSVNGGVLVKTHIKQKRTITYQAKHTDLIALHGNLIAYLYNCIPCHSLTL